MATGGGEHGPVAPGAAEHVQPSDAGAEGTARPGEHVGARALLDDAPTLEDDHPVGEQQGVEGVVRDDHRGAVGEHPAQRLPDGGRDGDVEGGHRLVEQEQPWLRGQGSGDGGALGLATGELGRLARRELLDADVLQPRPGHRARLLPAGARAAGTEGDVVEDGEVREQQGFLRERGDPPVVRGDEHVPAGADVGEHPVVEDDTAAVRAQQPGQHLQDRRLPGPVGPEQRDGLPLGHVEGEVHVPVRDERVVLNRHTLLLPCRAKPMTSTATTTSTSESATAPWASVSRRR